MAKKTSFTLILCLIGFMLAVQYNTVQQPNESRDTRDVWEIRQELAVERERHSMYLAHIERDTKTIEQYKSESVDDAEEVLRRTLSQLQQQAGISAYEGPGVTIQVEPAPEAALLGLEASHVSPALLLRFVNDIYRYKGKSIAIAGERLVYTTAIRTIAEQTTINSRPIPKPPFAIQVATANLEDAQYLANRLKSSTILDAFYIDNIAIIVEEPHERVVLPAFDGDMYTSILQEQQEGE